MHMYAIIIAMLLVLPTNVFTSNEPSFWQIMIGLAFGSSESSEATKPTLQHQYRIDFEKVRTRIEDKINCAFGIGTQPWHIKKEAMIQREVIADAILEQLKTVRWHSQQAAEREANNMTDAALVHYIGEKAEQYALQEIKKLPRPPAINPQIIAEDIKREVINIVDQSWNRERNDYCSLCSYYGESLKNYVQYAIRQHEPVEQSYYPVRPSAPPAEEPATKPTSNEIFEIYPEMNLERNKDFHARREHGKLHREDACSSCLDDFKEIGRRVTLFCGHSICPNCLFGWLFINNKTDCPICRQEIQKAEFGVEQLRPHVNLNELKNQFPNDHAKIRTYFPWG